MNTLIAKKAPNFKASAVLNGKDIVQNFTLEKFHGSKYVLIFFYPKDFTFVCPTEIYAFQEKIKDFESRNVQVIAISTDTEQSHWAWLQIPKEKGGIYGVTYPLVSDINKTISHNYGVLSGDWILDKEELKSTGELVAYRGLFLIDKQGIIRHILINDFPLGRNVNEAIRMIDALQYYEKSGEVCPANWIKGKRAIKASYRGLLDFYSS